MHYQQAHVNRCSMCSKNFPTAHFLNLHIEENHDSLVVAMRARGEKTVSITDYLGFWPNPILKGIFFQVITLLIFIAGIVWLFH